VRCPGLESFEWCSGTPSSLPWSVPGLHERGVWVLECIRIECWETALAIVNEKCDAIREGRISHLYRRSAFLTVATSVARQVPQLHPETV
jgi:hypothetical protein